MELNKIFEQFAKQMEFEIDLTKMAPKDLRGRIREVLVKRFLRPFLPDRLEVGGGTVISTSKLDGIGEIDLIIYDKSAYNLFRPFAYFMPRTYRPFPVEVVHAVIEVENHPTKEELEKTIKRIAEVKQLQKTAYYEDIGDVHQEVYLYGKTWKYFPIYGALFILDDKNLTTLYNDIKEIYIRLNIPIEQQIDVICILKKGLIIYYDTKNDQINSCPKPEFELRIREGSSGENLSMFYRLIMYILTQSWTKSIRLNDYFNINKKSV